MPVGAIVGCEDRLDDDDDDDNVKVDDTDVNVEVDGDGNNGVVADVGPAWLAEVRWDEDGAPELLLLLVALALDL